MAVCDDGLRTYYLPACRFLEVCIDLDFALSSLLCRSSCAYHTIPRSSISPCPEPRAVVTATAVFCGHISFLGALQAFSVRDG